MIKSYLKRSSYILFVIITIAGCVPPRTVTQSGKVTPHKQIKVGVDYSGNVSTHTVKSVYKGVESIATPLINEDTIILDDALIQLNKSVLAYSIDPIGMGYNFYARYGVIKHFDVGYKYASGTHVFDGMYQFMGSSGTFDNPEEGSFYGSVGLQFSAKKYDLPSWSGLDKAQKVFGFDMKRKDFLVPLVFSIPFGEEEKIGNFSFGLVYAHTFIKYGFESKNLYDTLNTFIPEAVNALDGKTNFSSYGMFVNFKAGYKFVYFLPSFAMYYQNYGTYKLFDGSETKFKGMTFVPSIGIQINPSEIANGIKKAKNNRKSK